MQGQGHGCGRRESGDESVWPAHAGPVCHAKDFPKRKEGPVDVLKQGNRCDHILIVTFLFFVSKRSSTQPSSIRKRIWLASIIKPQARLPGPPGLLEPGLDIQTHCPSYPCLHVPLHASLTLRFVTKQRPRWECQS